MGRGESCCPIATDAVAYEETALSGPLRPAAFEVKVVSPARCNYPRAHFARSELSADYPIRLLFGRAPAGF